MNMRILNGILGFSLLGFLVFGSCNKGNPDLRLDDPAGSDQIDFDYSVTGVKDLRMEQLDVTEMKIAIQKTSFHSEEVGITIPNLPKGLKASYSPGYALASFPATIRFEAVRMEKGVYPLVLETYSSHTEKKQFPFTLTIEPYSNDALAFHAEFTESRQCGTTGSQTHKSFLEPVEDQYNQIRIKGFWSSSWKSEVLVHLHPSDRTLTIPLQTINNSSIEGRGTYSEDTLHIDYRVTTQVYVDSCKAVFTRDL